MTTTLFKITPTPPTTLELPTGGEGKFSFTVESLAAPDAAHDVMLRALLVGPAGESKEVDWLVAGPQRTLTMSGGKIETVHITAKPPANMALGEHTLKLVVADKDRPNDVYVDSQPVTLAVIAATTATEERTRKPPRWPIPAVIGGLVLVGGGVVAWKLFGPTDHDGETCRPNTALRCDGDTLVRCNAEGRVEAASPCALGCNSRELRCMDIDPSNGLAAALDEASRREDLDLGATATIDTDTGAVTVDGEPVTVYFRVLQQEAGPPIRVFEVGSLNAGDVAVTGSYALAFASNADIKISGHFSVSARGKAPGPGAQNDTTCQGKSVPPEPTLLPGTHGKSVLPQPTLFPGTGGGGFGTPGGDGGAVRFESQQLPRSFWHTVQGGAGGGVTGTATLIPLRGGCDSGTYQGKFYGAGGGAIQLVSRTRIVVDGIISANGSSGAGGGSGGGILLEAPIVQVSGNLVANGGGGAGGASSPIQGADGLTNDQPASGGAASASNAGDGGAGAAGTTPAMRGQSIHSEGSALGGHGGGGAGRIRINTAPDGFTRTGIISPNPTTGILAIR